MAWFSGNYIELQLSKHDAHTGYHQGQCNESVAYLRTLPHIIEKLDALDPDRLIRELREYGAWDDAELSDHDANLSRILWLACGDICDQELEDDE